MSLEVCRETTSPALTAHRIRFNTVAFGPPDIEYRLLQQMAAVIPGSSFQKLGLAASGLTSCFSSFSSMLSSMRTSLAEGRTPMTLRSAWTRDEKSYFYESIDDIEESDCTYSATDSGWNIYIREVCARPVSWPGLLQ